MIKDTNIQFDGVINELDTSNRTAKKNLEIEYRDRHYIRLAYYININTKDKVRIVKDKVRITKRKC